ncbi:hypothetical protein [Flavobacterium aquidurense]|jgi:hypothetical protein|uniref:hypothetical protein n=1 Tax=Flavobacterium aquidurense TaxID=362413 RepID=UPI00285C141C|nr:hypothetical protein [Flavobacterium aquidurense]MDR7372616.1 hypothetical protein [Flavobacterium aquidurense]
MKKAALTFGLFASLMIATSFTTPQTVSPSYASKIDLEIDGATGGTQKKRDYHGGNIDLQNNQLKLSSVNQSVGGNKKID